METANLVLTAINTVAMVVSAIAAVLTIYAKNEVKKIHNQMTGNNSVQVSGDVSVKNDGDNQGIMSGVNTGEIRK